jgi:hypothetical protein
MASTSKLPIPLGNTSKSPSDGVHITEALSFSSHDRPDVLLLLLGNKYILN